MENSLLTSSPLLTVLSLSELIAWLVWSKLNKVCQHFHFWDSKVRTYIEASWQIGGTFHKHVCLMLHSSVCMGWPAVQGYLQLPCILLWGGNEIGWIIVCNGRPGRIMDSFKLRFRGFSMCTDIRHCVIQGIECCSWLWLTLTVVVVVGW